MCGIAGFIADPINPEQAHAEALKMQQRLGLRGPDDRGFWWDAQANIALVHTRLSIIDLSPLGHQPMSSSSGRFTISFNGEIYNYADIRKELESCGRRFKGGSDTEVMLEAFEQWGIEPSLKRFIGMFAFGLFDRVLQTITLARDRFGVKPLYYGWVGRAFVFASELSAITCWSGFSNPVSNQALASLLEHNYIPAPESIYEKIFKLPQSSFITLSINEARSPQSFSPWASSSAARVKPKLYWALPRPNSAITSQRSDQEVLAEFESILRDSVRLRMVSDVPIGAFLSGGVDSSLVVAYMQELSTTPVKTFSIGFQNAEYDEAPYARKVAKLLGTEHCELYLGELDLLGVISKLPSIFSEPFADSSMIPTYLVSKLARQSVTVSLSGDGGDELAMGYSRFVWADKTWKSISRLPQFLRKPLGACLHSLSPQAWDSLFSLLTPLLPPSFSFTNRGEKLFKLAECLGAANISDFYQSLLKLWNPASEVLQQAPQYGPEYSENEAYFRTKLEGYSNLRLMDFLDISSYLSDDLMVKVDRSSMAVSLESREPLLDHRLFEYIASIPESYCVRAGRGKWILRELLSRKISADLVDRPKKGFSVPLGSWLRGPLRDWAEELLSERKLGQSDKFNVAVVRRYWQQHTSGARNFEHQLWSVLMFQAWREATIST